MKVKTIISSQDGTLGLLEYEGIQPEDERRVFFINDNGTTEWCSYRAFMAEGARARTYGSVYRAHHLEVA